MRYLFSGIVFIHGLIHLMGPAKAWGLAELPPLTRPISRPVAWLWLTAAVLMVAVAILFLARPASWWTLGIVAALVSQAAILTAWRDARAGTVANLLVLVVAALAMANLWPERAAVTGR